MVRPIKMLIKILNYEQLPNINYMKHKLMAGYV